MPDHRRKHVSPPLETRETWIIVLLSACLLWTTWALGGVKLWGQYGTNVLALATFIAAVLPSKRHCFANLRDLARFIPFWLGLFVAAYIMTQALNASWLMETGPDGKTRTVALDFIKWLPNGVAASGRMMNPWRMLLIFLPCWLVTCSIWTGCRRPRSMRILLWVVSLNGATFAVIGILQALTHTSKLLWLFDRPVSNRWFWGMMANQNHAAAFMNLALAAALALFVYYTGRHARDLSKGGVYLMLIPVSILIIIGVLQAMSRAGIISTALIVVIFLVILARRLYAFMREENNRTLLVAASCIFLLIAAGVSFAMRRAINFDKLEHEVNSIFTVADSPETDARFFINRASIDLFEKRPWYGWGAGCYRYFVSSVQKNYPPLMTHKNKPVRIVYAHNEYLNSLCDLGIVGSLPLFAGIVGLPAYVLLKRRKGVSGALWVGLAGIGVAMLHMSLEFFMQHPLAALQFALLLALVTRMACLAHLKERERDNRVTEEV